jgi:hypothetical protein
MGGYFLGPSGSFVVANDRTSIMLVARMRNKFTLITKEVRAQRGEVSLNRKESNAFRPPRSLLPRLRPFHEIVAG